MKLTPEQVKALPFSNYTTEITPQQIADWNRIARNQHLKSSRPSRLPNSALDRIRSNSTNSQTLHFFRSRNCKRHIAKSGLLLGCRDRLVDRDRSILCDELNEARNFA